MVTYINITVTILVCVKNNIDYFGRTYVHIKIQRYKQSAIMLFDTKNSIKSKNLP